MSPSPNTFESTGSIACIIKENGTPKNIRTPADAEVTYISGGELKSFAFLELATSLGEDSTKTVNKQDIVGTHNQKITEGSLEEITNYDALAVAPAALGNATIEHTAGDVSNDLYHGLTVTNDDPQYIITTTGLRKMFRSDNTYTIRVFHGCRLDANGDADIKTAKEAVDYERCHVSTNNQAAAGGGDVTVSVTFDAETVTFPASWDALPN